MSGHPLLEAIDNQLYRLRRRLRATDISITDGPPGRKPHYMHWRTFERCRYAWQELLRLRDHALTVEVYALAGILRTAYALDNGVPPLRQADLVEDMQERWKEWKRGESHA